MFRRRLVLPIYFHTNESLSLENMGIKKNIEESMIVREISFLSIDFVEYALDEEDLSEVCPNSCFISVGGTHLHVDLPKEVVEALIDEHL